MTKKESNTAIASLEQIATLREFVTGAASPPLTRDELHTLCNTAEAYWRARKLLERAVICIEAATKTLPDYTPSLYPGPLIKDIRALLAQACSESEAA
jgi:hypothetical protein